MTIKTRIALLFSILTAFILISLSISIYWFSYSYNEIQYFSRLHERVNIAQQYYLGEKELGSKIIEEIRQRHLQLLPEEREFIFQIADTNKVETHPDSLLKYFPHSFIDQVIIQDSAEYRRGDVMAYGRKFYHKGSTFVVIVSAYDEFGESKMADLRNKLLALFFVYLALVFVIGRVYAIQILRPINRIIQKVNQIRSTNLHIRLDEEKENDEIGELSKTFNRMLDRVETSIEIQNNFVSNASHELKNPLTAILGEIEITLSKPRSNEEYKTSMQEISREATRLHALTLHLLRLAQTSFDDSTLKTDEFRIDELLFDVKDDLEESNRANRIVLNLDHLPEDPDLLNVRGNGDLIKIALTNIIENGCKFSKNDVVTVDIMRTTNDVIITVVDKGIGIPVDELKNIYVPFFRATNARVFNGFGIGMPLTLKIVTMHQGFLDVRSTVGVGTTVILRLPASQKA